MDKKALDMIYYVMLKYNGRAEMENGWLRYKIFGYKGRVNVVLDADFGIGQMESKWSREITPIYSAYSDEVEYV